MEFLLVFNNKKIGEIIRKKRSEKQLSQEVLSGLAGIARSHLSMIETGDKHPNLETFWRISCALGIKPHQLLKEIEDALSK